MAKAKKTAVADGKKQNIVTSWLLETLAKEGHSSSLSTQADRVLLGIPFPHFSQQWFFCTTAYVVGRVNLLVGPSGSLKSTFLCDLAKLHYDFSPDSLVCISPTESRDIPDLRRSIVGPENDDKIQLLPSSTIEEWQQVSTYTCRAIKENNTKKGPYDPVLIGVDSLSGVTSQATVDSIEEDGYASVTFARDANIINTYLKCLPGRVAPWPISWVGVNHVKFQAENIGGRIIQRPKIVGGDSLTFHSTVQIYQSMIRMLDRQNIGGGARVKLKTLKNSLGERQKELEVEVIWNYDEAGVQSTYFDWASASVELINGHGTKNGKYSDVADIINFPTYNAGVRSCNCPALGIKKPIPLSEVGNALMADEAIVTQLHSFYGIHPVHPMQPGVDWREQVASALEAGSVFTGHPDGEGEVPINSAMASEETEVIPEE